MINNGSNKNKSVKTVKSSDSSQTLNNEDGKNNAELKTADKSSRVRRFSQSSEFYNSKFTKHDATSSNKSRSYSTLKDDPKPTTRAVYQPKGVLKGNLKKDFEPCTSRRYQETARDFVDDCKISKILRRLIRDDNPESFTSMCYQLQDSFTLLENERYIRKAVDFICEAILDSLHTGPGWEARLVASSCLSHLAISLENEAESFLDWIFLKYFEERNTEVKQLLMKSVLTMLQLDKQELILKDFSTILISNVQVILESTEDSSLLLTTGEVLYLLMDMYIQDFAKYFRDTVDIVIGWHIDTEQPSSVTRVMSLCLQRLSPYWIADLPFTASLLGQLIDDVEKVGYQYYKLKSDNESVQNGEMDSDVCLRKTILFMKVFNSVAKAVGDTLTPTNEISVFTFASLGDSLKKIVNTISLCMQSGNVDQEVIITGNECAWLIISLMKKKLTPGEDMCNLIYKQLECSIDFNNYAVASMLQFIAKVIEEGSTNLPKELVGKLLGSSSPILKHRLSQNIHVHQGIIAVYHSLLNLKNIPLLQEAYRYILGDMERVCQALGIINVSLCCDNPHVDVTYSKRDAFSILLLDLTALSDLANASVSFISMWMLQPCILELLAIKLKSFLIGPNVVLKHVVLNLLYSHCTKYTNYISSSELTQDKTNVCDILKLNGTDIAPTSTTSGHLTIILNLLTQLISKDNDEESWILILNWITELLTHAQKYFNKLVNSKEFSCLVEGLHELGYVTNNNYVISTLCDIFDFLKQHSMNKPMFLMKVAKLCLMHITSNDEDITRKYKELMLTIPLGVIWRLTNGLSKNTERPANRIIYTCKYHMGRETAGQMQAQNFKMVMKYIMEGCNDDSTDGIKAFVESFYKCWDISSCKNEFGNMVPQQLTALQFWAAWESAQYCVFNKLRTPLGKPQDTFMAIEGALKALARETTKNYKGSPSGYTLSRVRLLLEFVEQLEKCMYNASEGTAVSLQPPSKIVKTFFHTNKITCTEWLTRIRLILVVVSLYCGFATSAIRNGYCLLQDLLLAQNTKDSNFENAIMLVSWALYSINESEAIEGLRKWSNRQANIDFTFLKALSNQAAHRYEKAIEDYQEIVDTENDKSTNEVDESEAIENPLSDNVRLFIADQITECYLNLNDWTELRQWKDKEETFLKNINGGCAMERQHNLTIDDVDWFKLSESMDFINKAELPFVNKTRVNGSKWSCCHQIRDMKKNVLHEFMISNRLNKMNDVEKELKDYNELLDCVIREDIKNFESPILQQALTQCYFINSLQKTTQNMFSDLVNEKDASYLNTKILGDISWWMLLKDKLRGYDDLTVQKSHISLQLARIARKEGNLNLASRELAKCLHRSTDLSYMVGGEDKPEEKKYYKLLLNTVTKSSGNIWNLGNTDTFLQIAKLFYSYGNESLAIDVCSTTAIRMGSHLTTNHATGLSEKLSRSLVLLTKWLSKSEHSSILASNGNLQRLLYFLEQNTFLSNVNLPLLEIINDGFVNCGITDKEATIGRLLKASLIQSPNMGKSWYELAGWCYKWSRKLIHEGNNVVLSPLDKLLVDSFIPSHITNKEEVYLIITHIKPPTEEEDIQNETINTIEMIEWQLRSIGQFSSEQIAGLIEVWKQTHSRIYAFYSFSAQAYFKYLQLYNHTKNETGTITATLRLLRIIVKYALELQNVLEVELGFTPTAPWKFIIPQLFSRLSHPESYVRRRISELLCRLAEDSPHLIIFPAVVGSDNGTSRTINNLPTTELFKSCITRQDETGTPVLEGDDGEDDVVEEEEEEDYDNNSKVGDLLENCYMSMVDTLAKQDSKTIDEVKILVNELRRITLLWDELWIGALNQQHSDMARRVNQLEMEVMRVECNNHLTDTEKNHLISEKYNILLKPLLFVLEQLQEITSATPETPHEKRFQEKYGELIDKTINALGDVENARKPQIVWKLLKDLQWQLQERASKRSSYSLKISDISPALASLKNTNIAMPGVEQYITISSVYNYVTILPTKTKPKKLIFQGSNGKSYTYLFKGLEDLHLDERIMQFLKIANTMLEDGGFKARHYSVIPLGPRSGLISWVDHVTPIFALYKRWQQRQASTNQSTVLRPSELFYGKLTPLLKQHGISNVNDRKQWPLSILKQVLTSLVDETPDYLLARELWCGSTNSGSWWKIIRNYSTSLAVMSVIGYIIGLGDRHLDNILVHLTTGEVVHIDYNICFEKGSTLRVPEKVPFRMTQNLVAALGVTGIEGIFRSSCEFVLKSLKEGKETLLTLLEAFLYDPLIDWTTGIENGYTGAVYGGGRSVAMKNKENRKQLEKDVTTAMFSVRITEMKFEWLENKKLMEEQLEKLYKCIEVWVEEGNKMKILMENTAESHQQLSILKAAVTNLDHPLYTLYDRFVIHEKTKEKVIRIKNTLNKNLQKHETHLAQYKAVLLHLQSGELGQLQRKFQNTDNNRHGLFEVIIPFLNSTGQNQIAVQCSQIQDEVENVRKEEKPLIGACLDLLNKYSCVISYYPTSGVLKHRSSNINKLIQPVLSHPNQQILTETIEKFEDLYSMKMDNMLREQQVWEFSTGLQHCIVETDKNLEFLSNKLKNTSITHEEIIAQAEQSMGRTIQQSRIASQCAIITALLALDKKFLKMESAASGAGDCLAGLTSINGDWFFDDMCISIEIAVRLTSYIIDSEVMESDANMRVVVKCIECVHNVYNRLQELNMNFSKVILPEMIKCVISEEESVMKMLTKLLTLVNGCNVPLEELLTQLMLHLRLVVMDMPSPYSECSMVDNLREGYNYVLTEEANEETDGSSSLSRGQMLLMGLNGLFENLFANTNELYSLLPSLLLTNSSWKPVDLIKDSRALVGPIFKKESQVVLRDIFFVKYLLMMKELLNKCDLIRIAFKGDIDASPTYLSYHHFNKLVRKFIADYLSFQLLGLFSHSIASVVCLMLQHIGFNITAEVEQKDIGAESRVSLEELLEKAINKKQKIGEISQSGYSNSLTAINGVQCKWRRHLERNKLIADAESEKIMLDNLNMQYTCHWWLHQDLLQSSFIPRLFLVRDSFISSLRELVENIVKIDLKMNELKSQEEGLITTVEQRLRWAAGSNPNISQMKETFERQATEEMQKLQEDKLLISTIINIASCVIEYESLSYNNPETETCDKEFISLLREYLDVFNALMINGPKNFVTPAEQNLMRRFPATKTIDADWISKADNFVSEVVKDLTNKLKPLKERTLECEANVKSNASVLRNLLGKHQQISADVRCILKSMTKFEENSGISGIPDYLARHKTFVDMTNMMVKDIVSSDVMTLDKSDHILKQVQLLTQQISYIYDDVMKFSIEKINKPQQQQIMLNMTADQVTRRDPKTGKATQEKNAHAMNVWKRVRLKLEGKHPPGSRKLTVEEQIDWIIDESMNIDNLAVLYEGWTPWV